MGFIYKFENNITQEKYIGQTIRSINKRYYEHICRLETTYDSQKNSKFHQALLIYGINNFSFVVLEECQNDKLNEREIYWINYYDSFYNGYNMTRGGSGLSFYDREEILELWQQQYSFSEILNIINCSKTTLTNILNELNIPLEERRKRANLYKTKKVQQYTLNEEYIQTFNSVKEAAKAVNSYTSSISYACNHKLTCAAQFLWKYEDDITDITFFVKQAKKSSHHRNQPVNQYDLNGNFIQTFKTMTEAKNAIGAKSITSITNACTGRSKTAYGFKWKYAI